MTEEQRAYAEKHIASLRALSDWLIANDHDMSLPDTVDCDPDDTADLLASLIERTEA